MKRRDFLAFAFLTPLATGMAGSGFLLCIGDPSECLFAQPELLRILDEDEVIRIGESYRNRNSAEDDAEVLERKIEAAAGRHAPVASASLRNVIAADFEEGRTVRVNGWMLSITEARQCALYSLRST